VEKRRKCIPVCLNELPVALPQGGPKNRTAFLRVDNFPTVNGKKACDMSNVSEFCLETGSRLSTDGECLAVILAPAAYVITI